MKTHHRLTTMLIGLWGFPHVATFTNTWHLSVHPIHDTTVMLTSGNALKGAYSREHSGPEKIASDDGVETLFRLSSMQMMSHPTPTETTRSSGVSLQLVLPTAIWLVL